MMLVGGFNFRFFGMNGYRFSFLEDFLEFVCWVFIFVGFWVFVFRIFIFNIIYKFGKVCCILIINKR